MLALLSFGLLVLSALTLAGLRAWRVGRSYTWPVAAIGSLLAWASVFAWQWTLPERVETPSWLASLVFTASPGLYVDTTAWVFGMSLCGLAAGVILTAPARQGVGPEVWLATLAIIATGILAVLADSPFALVMIWAAIDLLEFVNAIRLTPTAALSERAVVAFALRALGTGFAMWAMVLGIGVGSIAGVVSANEAGMFYIIAAGLRLGVLPLHIAYVTEPGLRRGFGTTLRLTAAASSLALLARFPSTGINSTVDVVLLVLSALATLYGGWKWLTGRDALAARPYWIIGIGGLSLGAVLTDNPGGATAWAAVMILLGGVAFLNSITHRWLSRLLALGGLFILSLPATVTATAWQGQDNPLGFLLWVLFLPGQALLAVGFVMHMLRLEGDEFSSLPRWAQASFPVGLIVMVFTLFVLGLFGWPGALQIGVWPAALAVFVLAAGLVFTFLRLPILRDLAPAADAPARPSRFTQIQLMAGSGFWGMYRFLSRIAGFSSDLFEGDGSLLWTLVLLVLFISILQAA